MMGGGTFWTLHKALRLFSHFDILPTTWVYSPNRNKRVRACFTFLYAT
jgi:hypothetical protein